MKAIMQNIHHPEQREVILDSATPGDLALWLIQNYADDHHYIIHPELRIYQADHVEISPDGDTIEFDDDGIVVDAKHPADRYTLGDYVYYLQAE